MQDTEIFYRICSATLGTFDKRQSFTPGMFEPLKPLFMALGYDSVAVYVCDDYPDRMQVVSGYDEKRVFPSFVAKNNNSSLLDALRDGVGHVPGVLLERLFNHNRELGALAVVHRNAEQQSVRFAFDTLAKSLSLMAYIERIRTNSRREREERDLFFAQSLTNRLLVQEVPEVEGLRLGSRHFRSLDAGGDFYDFLPTRNDTLIGYVGSCNGKGLRTVMEVVSLMRLLNKSINQTGDLAAVMHRLNRYLVEDKKRRHQASLCLFEIDKARCQVRLVKAGELGIALLDRKRANNVSIHGGVFLGMIPDPKIQEEVFDFPPGSSLFCVTEGFYNSSINCLSAPPQPHWFFRALEGTIGEELHAPLAEVIFDLVNNQVDFGTRALESMLSISVEHLSPSKKS